MSDYGRHGDYDSRDRDRYREPRDDDRPRSRGSMFGGDSTRDDRDREPDGRQVETRSWRDNDRGGGSSWFGGSSDRDTDRGRDHDRDRDRDTSRDTGRDTSRDTVRDTSREVIRDRTSGRDTAQRERQYGSDDSGEGLAIDETSRLIASNKVEGTAVYGRDGQRMGSIYNFMVDKQTGKVDYAVMSSGGFLGMGTRYFPVPWQILRYDVRQGGYRVDMTARDFERAPSFDRGTEPDFDNRYGDRVNSWYGVNAR